MSSIAEAALKNPRKIKEEARQKKVLEDYNKAREKSTYHWVDVQLLLASGLRRNNEIRSFATRCHDKNINKQTPQLIVERDRLLAKYLPQLQEAGLVSMYSMTYIHTIVKANPEDKELQAFWLDFVRRRF